MLRQVLFSALIALAFAAAASSASAKPDDQGATLAFETSPAQAGFVGLGPSEAHLLRVRDTQAANSGTGGHGRGPNSCWSACFNDYNACMDRGPENVCVSRMKTCLAICDRISRRPDM